MKKRDKKHKKEQEPDLPGDIWIEGHKLNEKTGKLEPVRYKLKHKRI
jgi:hypothetical protein